MHAGVVSMDSFRSLRAAVGILLAASCGIVHAEVVRAPDSKLISRPELKFVLDQRQSESRQLATLLHEDSGGKRTEVALIEASVAKGRARVAVRSFAASGDMGIATLERLYTLVLRMDPEAGFCFTQGTGGCDASLGLDSHSDALRRIALARENALTRAAAPGASWRPVSMGLVETGSRDPDVVSVRLSSAGVPLADVRIFFNQAPHSACVGKTDADGVAKCRLVDEHGDEDEHAGELRAVVATFPGDVKAEPVLPPTTYIVRAGGS